MSNTKKVLFPYPILDNVDISLSHTSEPTNVQFLDYGLVDIKWTGTSPVGNINVEVLEIPLDKNYSGGIDVWKALNFSNLVGGEDIPISGASGSHQIQLNRMPSSKIRFKYNRTSGIGNLTVIISGKEA